MPLFLLILSSNSIHINRLCSNYTHEFTEINIVIVKDSDVCS